MNIERVPNGNPNPPKKTTIENWLMYGGGALLVLDLMILRTMSWVSVVGSCLIFASVIYIFWHYRSNLKYMHFLPRTVKDDEND